VLPEVHVQEEKPKCFFRVALPLVHDRCFQWVEQEVCRICSAGGDAALAQEGDELDSSDAFKNLFDERPSASSRFYSRQRAVFLCERSSRHFDAFAFGSVGRFHGVAPVTVREIQSRIALIAPFVTPKLL